MAWTLCKDQSCKLIGMCYTLWSGQSVVLPASGSAICDRYLKEQPCYIILRVNAIAEGGTCARTWTCPAILSTSRHDQRRMTQLWAKHNIRISERLHG